MVQLTDSPTEVQQGSLGVLFWNLNKKSLESAIRSIADEHNIDLIILAENSINTAKLLIELNTNQEKLYFVDELATGKVNLIHRLPAEFIEPVLDDLGISIRHITPPVGNSRLLVSAHFPSKLHRDEIGHLAFASRVSEMITAAEEKYNHTRTILVGDFNMNPFESGIVAANGLHAIMSRNIAKRDSRLVDSREHRYFYNPMWGRLGDSTPGPPGTYHYGPDGHFTYFWNIFDQVLIRPSILDYFPDSELKILTESGRYVFSDQNGLPNQNISSDHFPIIFRINAETQKL